MRFQVRVLLLIIFITLVNYSDRSALSFAIQPMQQELSLNNAEFGIILGAFAFGYLAMSFVSGFIIDRFGYQLVWSLGAVFWSCCTLAFVTARGFWSLLFLRILLGIAEGLHFPALLKCISDWLSPAFRVRAISWGLLGIPLSLLAGAPFLTFLMTQFSWRMMFIVLGLFGLLWAAVWPLCFRGRKNPHYASTGLVIPEEPLKKISILRGNPSFISNCIAYFALGYIIFFALFWLPGYLEKQLHVSISSTGSILMLPWALSAVLLVLGGIVSDAIYKRTQSRRIARTYLIAGGQLIGGICFFLLAFSTTLWLQIFLLTFGLGLSFATYGPIYALNVDLFPRRTATSVGIMIGFFSLSGIIAPTATGFLVQATGSFQSAFVLLAAICAIGALSAFFFQRDHHPAHG